MRYKMITGPKGLREFRSRLRLAEELFQAKARIQPDADEGSEEAVLETAFAVPSAQRNFFGMTEISETEHLDNACV